MSSGCPFFSRNVNDVYFLLEDMASYNYHWYISPYNGEEHKDHLEDIHKMLEELRKINREMKSLIFNAIYQQFLWMSLWMNQWVKMKKQVEEKPSFPEEMEPLPQESKECVLPMILTSSQSIPNLSKIHSPSLSVLDPILWRSSVFCWLPKHTATHTI